MAVFVAVVVLLPAASVSEAALCTSTAFATEFATISAEINACQTKTGITLELALPAASKKTICASCTGLPARANARSLPDCKIVQKSDGRKFTLQRQFEKLFKPCITVADSDSGSDDKAEATTTPAPAGTSTPVVTPTTPKPATTKTPKPTTAKPQTTTTAPDSTDDSTSGSAGSALEGGASLDATSGESIPASKTTSKTTDDADWDSNTNDNGAAKAASSSGSRQAQTLEMALGIAGGVLAVALLSAVFVVVMRRRRRSFDPDKVGGGRGDLSLNSSTGSSRQLPFQFSVLTSSTNRANHKWHATLGSSASTTSRTNLWEDEVIVGARIPKDKVMAMTLLSRGGFGEVYRGIYNHQQVAIKMLLPETRKDLKHISAFFAEIKLMAVLEHERIVQFIGVAWDSLNDACVVSEFMEGGDLKGVLSVFQEQDRPLGFDHTKIKIALHIAHALTYLHSLDPVVLHRDLKSKNILLDTELRAKLTDFGVSRERTDSTMTAAVGTSLWMAPEVMMGDRYDDKADVFSFGIVLSELDTHAIPYGEAKESGSGRRIPDSAVLQMIALGKLKVRFSTGATPEMAKLGDACVALDPRERPAMSEVLYALHTALKSMYVII